MPVLSRPAGTRLHGSRRLLVAALALIAIVVVPATPVAAATATDGEAAILALINKARAERGLVALVKWHDLAVVAGRRASRMASSNVLSHTISGSVSSNLNAMDVPWYRTGETIGYSTVRWPMDSARAIFRMWRDSPAHWALLMSDRYNYVGVGLAYRSSNHRTYGSVVLTESPDHSGARSWFTSASRSGDDIRWTWAGADRRLQTHTAGLRDFDVQYRVGGGSWRTIRNDTTATSITLRDRVDGRNYYLRIRATDRRGNVGAWTSASKIWVP